MGGCEKDLVRRGNAKSERNRENLFGVACGDESRIQRVGLGGWCRGGRDENGPHNKWCSAART